MTPSGLFSRWIAIAAVALLPLAHAASGGGDEERGLGGTGRSDTPTALLFAGERGLGGTGVVGTLTAFGSIWVDGIEIEYDRTTPVTVDGIPTDSGRLRVGQQLQVMVEKHGDGVHATRIAINREVVGPVESVDRQARAVTVLGQRVVPAAGVNRRWPTMRVGEVVAVSGYRAGDDTIQATDVQAEPGADRWVLRGNVRSRNGALYVGGFRLPQRIEGAGAGSRVELAGAWSDGRPVLEHGTVASNLPFDGKVERMLVEGQWDAEGGLRYAGGHVPRGAVQRDAVITRNGRVFVLILQPPGNGQTSPPQTPSPGRQQNRDMQGNAPGHSSHSSPSGGGSGSGGSNSGGSSGGGHHR